MRGAKGCTASTAIARQRARRVLGVHCTCNSLSEVCPSVSESEVLNGAPHAAGQLCSGHVTYQCLSKSSSSLKHAGGAGWRPVGVSLVHLYYAFGS